MNNPEQIIIGEKEIFLIDILKQINFDSYQLSKEKIVFTYFYKSDLESIKKAIKESQERIRFLPDLETRFFNEGVDRKNIKHLAKEFSHKNTYNIIFQKTTRKDRYGQPLYKDNCWILICEKYIRKEND